LQNKKPNEPVAVTESSGNVFADLGVPQPGLALVKANLAHRIGEAIREQGLTQTDAASVLGVNQPKVSALLCGKLDGFTLDRLLKFLNLLNLDVEIAVKPVKGKKKVAETCVVGA